MKIEARRIKYVIAREGLIIIFLFLCAGASYYANSWQSEKIENYVKDAKEFQLTRNENVHTFDALMESFDSAQKVQFQNATKYDVIENTLKKDLWHNSNLFDLFKAERTQPTNTHIVARYDVNGNKLFIGLPWEIDFLKVMTFFLFIAYPAYLLIRFIMWAVITIRNKES